MPTTRNARGIDLIIYNQDNSSKLSLQVKALSKRAPVPLGLTLVNLFADFVVVCNKVVSARPDCYILTPTEVCELAHRDEKDGKRSYWLQPKAYEKAEFHNAWPPPWDRCLGAIRKKGSPGRIAQGQTVVSG